MGNYVIAGVGNYVIENPSNLGNYVIADIGTQATYIDPSPATSNAGRSGVWRRSEAWDSPHIWESIAGMLLVMMVAVGRRGLGGSVAGGCPAHHREHLA